MTLERSVGARSHGNSSSLSRYHPPSRLPELLSKAEWAEGRPSTHLLARSNDVVLVVNYSLDYRLKVGWLIGQTGIEISQSSEPSQPDRAPFVVRNNHFWINVGCG